MGRPLNMNPEDWAREIVKQQDAYIKELEQELADQPGGGPPGGGYEPTETVPPERPLNMNPEDYAREIIGQQQEEIERLEQLLEDKPGGGPPGGGGPPLESVEEQDAESQPET